MAEVYFHRTHLDAGDEMRPERIYEFAGHTLDLGRGRLQRGHEDVALRPKSLAMLVYLVENPGRVIDKEELIAAVWPNFDRHR